MVFDSLPVLEKLTLFCLPRCNLYISCNEQPSNLVVFLWSVVSLSFFSLICLSLLCNNLKFTTELATRNDVESSILVTSNNYHRSLYDFSTIIVESHIVTIIKLHHYSNPCVNMYMCVQCTASARCQVLIAK